MLNRPLSKDDYIINGEDAEPHSRPYQISYQQKTFTGSLAQYHSFRGRKALAKQKMLIRPVEYQTLRGP